MKKILFLCNDKSNFDLSNVKDIAREGCFELHGIFLQYNRSSADFYYPFLSDDPGSSTSCFYQERLEKLSNNILNQGIQQMKRQCEQAGISFYATIYDNCSLDELITDSAFADLMVLDDKLNLKEYFITSVNVCLTDLLTSLRCPVNMLSQPRSNLGYQA